MGLGGYLTWTAVARELVNNSSTHSKVVPYEQHGDQAKLISSPIFENNKYILQDFSDLEKSLKHAIPMQLNNPNTNYCKSDNPEKAVHRYDKHVIEQICEFYKIESPTLKCELYTTKSESSKIDALFQDYNVPESFIVIEPQTKDSYTVNKAYPIEKWQFVVNEVLKEGHVIVQVGQKNQSKTLQGVIDLTGLTTFREAAEILRRSRLLVSSEGGLMHAANSVSTPAVIVLTGFLHPNLTCYPENNTIWIGKNHGPCGMKTKCDLCHSDSELHDPNEIVQSIIGMIE